MKPEKGARVYVNLQGKKIAAIIQDFADSSRGDYYQVKIELLIPNALAPAQLLRQTYPRPVQSYRLTKRTITLPGEVQG